MRDHAIDPQSPIREVLRDLSVVVVAPGVKGAVRLEYWRYVRRAVFLSELPGQQQCALAHPSPVFFGAEHARETWAQSERIDVPDESAGAAESGEDHSSPCHVAGAHGL